MSKTTSDILEKRKIEYQWYKEHGICTRCHQRDAFYNHTLCEVCIEKNAMYNIKKSTNQEAKVKQQVAIKSLKDRRKAAGLCVKCGEPAIPGTTMCTRCTAWNRDRVKRYQRNKRGYIGGVGVVFRERMDAGLCMYCGKPQVPGYKTCEKHLEICRKNIEKNREKNNRFRSIIDESYRLAVEKKKANETASVV